MINHTDIEAMQEPVLKRWVKIPGSGDFRGEGEWKDYDKTMKEWGKSESHTNEQWDYLVKSKYLPTQISEDKPDDKAIGEKG